MNKILFVDSVHPLIKEELTAMGYHCEEFSHYTAPDYRNIAPEYTGIIIRSKIKIDKAFIDKAINLKFIGRVGSGLENIDVPYAENRGIRCLNSPEGNRDAVGEHTLGMLLALLNRICVADREIRAGIWTREGNRGMEIKGKTIGIIGYGNMGGAFARRLKGFEANVIAYDKYKSDYEDEYVRELSLDELCETADIVSLHVPLTDETHYLADEMFFQKFCKNFFLINTSRGQVVKTSALVAALKTGKVKGAALDVLEFEDSSFESLPVHTRSPGVELVLTGTGSDSGSGFKPGVPAIDAHLKGVPPDLRYLLEADNVVLTPHIAGWTVESNIKLAKVLVEKIRNILKT